MTKPYGDPERLARLIDTYEVRYGPAFWNRFVDLIGPESRAVVADFGCGPGMFLRDIAVRFEAEEIHGYDANKYLLKSAANILGESTIKSKVLLHRIDFDKDPMNINPESIDLGFSGYMLHEVADPSDFVNQIAKTIRRGGRYAILDYVSGDEEAFIRAMTELGIPEERAKSVYPRMCKHSADDFERILLTAGFSSVEKEILDKIRALAVGIRE
ncbi:MAG: class I SAM-dependent methyltransferase [Candidatus Thorarchaeota archaeon]|jgi:ubiquinone/menaquinone biosynthesis C-methylase UbiE